MNFFILAPVIAAISNLTLGIFAFTRNFRSRLNQIFFLFSLCLFLWNAGILMMFIEDDPDKALIISRLLHFAIIFTPFFFIHLVLITTRFPLQRIHIFAYSIPILLSVSNLTDAFIFDVKYSGYSYYGVGGPTFAIFTGCLFTVVIIFLVVVFRRMKHAGELERKKLRSLLWGLSILTVCGLHDTLPIFSIYQYPFTDLSIYPLGTIGSMAYGILIAYSVLQYQVLDIHTKLGKISATLYRMALMFFAYFLILLITALIFPNEFTPVSFFVPILIFIIIILSGAIFFPKLIGVGEEYLERRLLGDNFEYQDNFRRFTREILFYGDEDVLYRDLHDTLVHAYEADSYSIFILNSNGETFDPIKTHPESQQESSGIPSNSRLVRYFRDQKGSFFDRDRNRNLLDLQAFEDEGWSGGPEAKLCFPLRSGTELMGLLFVGQKVANRPVTNLDLTLFMELAANLGLFINQSRLKKQIARSQEVELLGNVSRGLAHDLNNLITPVFTYCQLTESTTEGNESLKEFGTLAKRNLLTAQAYIRESLFFSTNQEPKLREVKVIEILRDLNELHQSVLAARKVQFVISCPDDLVMTLDEVLIHRLLSNLINNAADASPEDSRIELTVRELNRSFQRQRWIRISVQDFGAGIPEDEVEKVFTPYFTTKDTGDKRRGSGLGLSIARRIVDIHQGSISISSKVGVGTRVEVDLPAIVLPSPPVSTEEAVQS